MPSTTISPVTAAAIARQAAKHRADFAQRVADWEAHDAVCEGRGCYCLG